MDDTRTAATPRPKRRRSWLPFVAALLLLTLATNVILFSKYHSAVTNNPLSQQANIEAAVQRDVLAPSGTPVISTVADKARLTNPALRSVVKNGDKILVYGTAKRLIVYRPSVGKVVTMLNIQDTAGGN